MMKAKGLVIAIFILAVAVCAFFGIGLLFGNSNNGEKEDTGTVFELSGEEISRIVYLYKGETYEFENEGGTWVFPADMKFPLKQRLVQKMSDTALSMRYLHRIDSDYAEESSYELDFPLCRLSLTTRSGRELRLDIGAPSALPDGYYARIPDDESIYVVHSDAACYLMDLPALADTEEAVYIRTNTVSSFSITDCDGSFSFTRTPEGRSDYYDKSIRWFMDNEENVAIPGDDSVIRELFSTLNTMEIKGCAYYPYSEAELSLFGLENGGIASITVCYADDDGTEHRRTLEMGCPETENPELFSYFHVEGSELICYARTEDLELIMTQGRDALLSKNVCVVNSEDIIEMELVVDGTRYNFTSEREAVIDQFGYETINSRYFLNGAEVPTEYFSTMQSGFSSLDAEAFAEDGEYYADTEPYIRIVYTTDTLDRATVEYVPYNPNFYLARFNGRDDMLVGTTAVRLAAARIDNLINQMQIIG